MGTSRTHVHNGAQEADSLRTILGGLTLHLENLSNDTDIIATALDEGGGAIGRLDTAVTSLGDVAGRALALPARRSQGAAGGQ